MPASLTPWSPSDGEPQELEKSPNGRYIRYNILLGKGACKRVYKALDTEEGLEVAWNQVDMLGMDRDEEARQHLQDEIRVLQQLKHKNIMTFYAWWYDKGNLHINFITELFTSGNLRQYRKKLKIMSENVLKRWAHQILEGLLYLHGHVPPIVHRDLKCDNIFVNSATGEVKIGDLGLATVQQTAMSVVGTPEFMAPEVYDESYDERCDIYSFGMCLLELATLEYPYAECHSVPQIFKKVTLGIPPESLARITPELREFISLCIAHNPDDRPSARELLKHPYLEAVRLGCTESISVLSSWASSGALASLSGGGAGSGWNTPSGTLHCAASVRDLREALHQQEAMARHHQQQQQLYQQHQQHQLSLHSSCPDVHAVAESAHGSGASGGGDVSDVGLDNSSSHGIVRSNTVSVAVLARGPSIVTPTTVPGQLSPLGRDSSSQCTSPTSTVAAAAVIVTTASPSVPTPPANSRGRAGSGGSAGLAAARRSGHSVLSSLGNADSDTDSDEEVLVPIELLKARLLEEGFVDPYAGLSTTRSPSPGKSKEQHKLQRRRRQNGPSRLQPRAKQQQQHHQHLQDEGEGLLQGPRHRLAMQGALMSGRPGTCKTIAEGDGTASGGAEVPAGNGVEAMTSELEDELELADGTEQEEQEEEAEEADCRIGTGRGEIRLNVMQPTVDVDPWAQRWTQRASLAPVVGQAYSGKGGNAVDVDLLPSLTRNVTSSANCTAKLLNCGNGGYHSRQGSADAVTFSVHMPTGASGASTPALRLSYSGVPASLQTPSQQVQQMSAVAEVALSQPSVSEDLPPALTVSPPQPPLAQLAAAASMDSPVVTPPSAPCLGTRGSMPSLDDTHLPQAVRLPSFRNRVLLTVRPAKGTAASGSAGGSPMMSYLRSTSARLDGSSVGGSSRPRDTPNLNCASMRTGHAAGGVPGYASLGGSTIFRRASAADVGAAMVAEMAPQPFAAHAIAAAAVSGADTARCEDEEDGVGIVTQSPSPWLEDVPEGNGEGIGGNSRGPIARLPPSAAGTSEREGSRRSSSGSDMIAGNPGKHTAVPTAPAAVANGPGELADEGLRMGPGKSSSSAAAAASDPSTDQFDKISVDGRQALPTPVTTEANAARQLLHPGPHISGMPVDMTVIKEMSRPIHGVIMRLKQWRRLLGLRSGAGT